jgi:superfamily II DNA/RNA helicase
LDDLCKKWDSVTDADDSKFAKFKDLLDHELFKASKNPEQKLVVFSESLDTVEYLKNRIGRDDVLVISSDNRKRLFTIIRDNFDANYNKAQKNDFNIIITTDVLAEGVNLHRSNIIVNYDTPWNSTKLMQRIGRVNRVGSKSKNIYNYVFYPSRQGNQEINLNKIALSKIQTFHTTFGEDNQIYSTEEILDRDLDKLFDAAIKPKEEVNLELPFYEELRTLYQENRKEYNRISKMSMRSRTGRNVLTVQGVTLNNDTLVFLKTNHRKIFYRVSDSSSEQLSPIDAMNYFKATKEEPAKPRIENHHEHVQKAIEKFTAVKCEEVSTAVLNAQQMNAGAQVTTAVNLLKTFLSKTQDDDEKIRIHHLIANVENGVIAFVARRLERMHKELSRGKLSQEQAQTEIFEMAKKYDAYFIANENLKRESESDPEIVLSESFS